jgi:hypothetical protein
VSAPVARFACIVGVDGCSGIFSSASTSNQKYNVSPAKILQLHNVAWLKSTISTIVIFMLVWIRKLDIHTNTKRNQLLVKGLDMIVSFLILPNATLSFNLFRNYVHHICPLSTISYLCLSFFHHPICASKTPYLGDFDSDLGAYQICRIGLINRFLKTFFVRDTNLKGKLIYSKICQKDKMRRLLGT